jgi:hypothetical protein
MSAPRPSLAKHGSLKMGVSFRRAHFLRKTATTLLLKMRDNKETT